MKTNTLKVSMFLCMMMIAMTGMSQEVPNGNFANWEDKTIPQALGGGTYTVPTGGWDCLNSLAPGSLAKVEGRTSSSTAVLLTSKKFTLDMGGGEETLATSCLMLGDFLQAFTTGEPAYGIPFSARPTKFTFWYKYIPKSGDRGRVMVEITQGPIKGNKYAWVGKVALTKTVNEWTKAEIDMTVADEKHGHYLSDFTPENLFIEATSSLTGLSTSTKDSDYGNAQEGSQLYITDMAFEYGQGGVDEHEYTVCGSADIFGPGPEGWGWDTNDNSNNMTLAGDNTYQLVKSNVALKAGTTYEYKVVQDHSWDVNWGKGGKNDTNNYTFTVPADGTYNVTFTFKLNEDVCSVIAVSASTPEVLTQIPNGSFANWEDKAKPDALGGGSYKTPSDYWDCFNILSPGTVTRTEGRTTGLSAALLESKYVDMTPYGFKPVTTAILCTDNYIKKMSGEAYPSGFPCNTIPMAVTFWYKYEPVGNDVAQVFLQFNEDLIVKSDVTRTVKFRKQITERTTEWTKGVILLDKDDKGVLLSDQSWIRESGIEACYIDITSSISGMSSSTSGNGADQPGSKFWITELQFTNDLTAIDNISNGSASVIKEIYDLTGRKLSTPSKGINIVKMSDGQTKKVLKK